MNNVAESAQMSQRNDWDLLSELLSERRLAAYLEACNGHKDAAVKLYLWNSEISSTFWELIGYLEVALRNVISNRFQCIHQARRGDGFWLLNESNKGVQLKKDWIDAVEAAQRRVKLNDKKLTGEQVVSELTLGFWQMTISKKSTEFWPDIASGFLGLKTRNQRLVGDSVESIRHFRNRIGHHHRIWNQDLRSRLDEILLLAHYIDPKFKDWMLETERVSALLAVSPVTVPHTMK